MKLETEYRNVCCPCLQRAKILSVFLFLITFSFFTVTVSSSACNTDPELTLRDKFQSSEMVIRGKIVRLGDSQKFIVKVLNVYKGCNSSEGQTVDIYNFPFGTENVEGSQPICMSSAVTREKYIFYLEGRSPHGDGSSYMQYIADRATKGITRSVRQLAQGVEPEECTDFVTTMATETQSDAEHYTQCSEWSQQHYCQNGGTCLHIVELNQDTCECPTKYHGSRCQFYMYAYNTGDSSGSDPTPFIIVGIMLAFILLLCLLVLVLYIKNRKKTHETLSATDVENDLSKDSPTDRNQNTTAVYHSSEDKVTSQTNSVSNVEIGVNCEQAVNEESSESEITPLTESNSQTNVSGRSKQSTV